MSLAFEPAFELAVESPHAIEVAARLGVDRIEVCAALAVHGVTPSLALIERAVQSGVPAHVLVRSRPGDFEYTPDEIDLMRADVRRAVDAGAAGVVVGGTRNGAVDTRLVRELTDAAGAAQVTFHRAFDTVQHPNRALDELVELGVSRVLTSGGAADVDQGLEALAGLVHHAEGAIEVMAGGGVTASNAAAVAATGVSGVHASARRRGVPGTSGLEHLDIDEAEARSIRDALLRTPATTPSGGVR